MVPRILVATLVLAPCGRALACGPGSGLNDLRDESYLSLQTRLAAAFGGRGAVPAVETTYSTGALGPHFSLGVQRLAGATDAYGDVGIWALASLAVGGGIHGASRDSSLAAGPELHAFVGVPVLPLPIDDRDDTVILEPFTRVDLLFGHGSNETVAQAGVALRFAFAVSHAREASASARTELHTWK